MTELHRIDLNLLVTLDVLLAERHVTRAASRLGLSQPAVSAQLRQLRETFGDPLLIPAPRGMTATARAEALREPLRHLLGELQGLVAAGRGFDPATARQTFRIVASDAIHGVATARLAARLPRLAPGCRVAMTSFDPKRTVDAMAAGEIDLLLSARPSMPAPLHARPLYDETFLCVMRRDHPLAAAPLDLDAFCAADHVLVSPTGGGFHGTVDDALAASGRSRRVAVSVHSFLLVPSVLASADLVATLPARVARTWSDRLAVRPLPCEVPGFQVAMGWHARAHADPAQLWLRETLVAAVEEA